MSIRQICKNLRTKGFKETYRIHRVHKCEEGLYGYATNRPYGNLPLEKRHKALEKPSSGKRPWKSWIRRSIKSSRSG